MQDNLIKSGIFTGIQGAKQQNINSLCWLQSIVRFGKCINYRFKMSSFKLSLVPWSFKWLHNKVTFSINAVLSSAFPTWHTMPSTSKFSAFRISTVLCTLLSFLLLTITFAPSWPNRRAIARPILLKKKVEQWTLWWRHRDYSILSIMMYFVNK